MQREPSGKFVLRVPSSLHSRLQREARRANVSLNQICLRFISSGLSHKGSEIHLGHPVPDVLVKQIHKEWKSKILGILLFGSTARGEATNSSDIDLLIVLQPGSRIERNLYTVWDRILTTLDIDRKSRFSPQFVSLPSSSSEASGLWCEVAIDGQVIWEADDKVSGLLRSLRRSIAEGEWLRKVTHGAPYWERPMKGSE